MKQFFTKFKGYFGIMIILISLVMAFLWETRFREELLDIQVVVLNQDVIRNEVITANMLNVVKRQDNAIIKDAITDPNEVIGLESKHYIPKGSQLNQNYFDIPEIVLNSNELLFRVPNNWLLVQPATIMRKDTAYFYPVSSEGKKEQEPIVQAKVAYVKDSVNREVTYTNQRLNASSVVSSIVIIVTPDKLNTLENYIQKGYQFLILHDER